MSLKTIVVHVDNSRATPARLAIAIAIAAEHEARVVGVHPRDTQLLPIYPEPSMALIEAQERWAEEEAGRSRELFRQEVAKANPQAEWRETSGDAVRVTAMHARHGDLLVVGQQDPDAPAFSTPATLVEELLFASGRPVLVVPFIGGRAPFRRILVAWNSSREATRAVNDALPLLERAEQVTVLAIDPEIGLGGHGDLPCADICLQLARHGVKAQAAQTWSADIDAGNVLLSYATDLGADLIVMGAYGHSRLRETVLGGVTRTILRHLTVPVLLAH